MNNGKGAQIQVSINCSNGINFMNFFLTFIYYVYNILSVFMPACQKREPDPITDGCEPTCGCWKLDSGPLEEQPMLLTSEPCLQPLHLPILLALTLLRPLLA